MTLQELAARDFKRAKINYLREKERTNTPTEELAHMAELVGLRGAMAELCGKDLISRAAVLALLHGSDATGYKPSALREMVAKLPSCPQGEPANWVQPHHNTLAACPVCGKHTGGYVTTGKWFCSACGAMVDGGAENAVD